MLAFPLTATGKELQVAARGNVEGEEALGAPELHPGEMRQRRALVLAQVVEQRARGGDGRRPVAEAEGLARGDGEVLAQGRLRDFAQKAVGLHRRDGRLDAVGRGGSLRQQQLGRAEPRQLSGERPHGDFASRELPGRDIGVGEADGRLRVLPRRCAVAGASTRRRREGDEIVVCALVEQVALDQGARRDDAHHFAVDEPLARRRVARLLADRDLVALLNQPRDVAIDGVIGDARERHAKAAAHRLGGERDLQLARGELRVVVERLVEVAHAKEDDRMRVATLDLEILASDGRHDGASRLTAADACVRGSERLPYRTAAKYGEQASGTSTV